VGIELTIKYDDLKELISMRRRDAMKIALNMRRGAGRPYGRRDISSTLKLAILAMRSLNQYIEVISWSRNVFKERLVRIR